jgi:hypothetical protein
MQTLREGGGYSSYSLLASALDGDEWSASRTGRALPPAKDPRYPLDRRLGGPQLVWKQRLEEKFFSFAGHRAPVIQSSQTLYWLRYPAPSDKTRDNINDEAFRYVTMFIPQFG